MSTTVLDDREQRRASVRAQAAAIADAPRPARRFSVPAGTQLRPAQRRRSHPAARAPSLPRVRWRAPRRLIAVAVLAVQVTLLVLALTLPVFKVKTVAITGTRLVTQASVLAAAAVPHQSIFTLDADSIRARVAALPWVESATVVTDLPATVRIDVTERTPAVRLRRDGEDLYVADDGATMPADSGISSLWTSTPPLLDERAGSPQPIDPALLRILEVTAQRFPSVFGCSVAAFRWDVDGEFSIWTSTGWRAVLGHVDTADALAGVPAQLSALAALRGQLDFQHPKFEYINVENPNSPTIAGKPGLPADVIAASTPLPRAVPYQPPVPSAPQPVEVSPATGTALPAVW